ncbi:MAG: efflux RND transporter permease subunit [Pseudomonadales bacterium]|nr:efflux RND transporter permease subunit [Pseudomonadales bacterium]
MWITRISIGQPVFATMVMLALVVLGVFSYHRLPVEQMPDVDSPMVSVMLGYPGASPEAIENDLLKPIENAINTVNGIQRIFSTAREGGGYVMVEFRLDTDMAVATQEMRDKIAEIQPTLPREAKDPLVSRSNEQDNAQPVLNLALHSRTRSLRELSTLADQVVVKRLQNVAGVGSVVVNGAVAREIKVLLQREQMRAWGVGVDEVIDAIRAANQDLPAGAIRRGNSEQLVRVEGRIREPRDFGRIIVTTRGGAMYLQQGGLPIHLDQVAEIVDGEAERTSIARIDGEPSLGINIFKVQGSNVVAVGQGVREAIEELRARLPPDVEFVTVQSNADFIEAQLASVKVTILEGAVLTVLIVFLFLHSWRSTVITGLTLPISVLATFIALHAFGFTLNIVTLMALSLCIGLLIDDAIVVRENIVRHLDMGKSHRDAAREGTEEIGLAVMATTFAILAVFVPVAFMGGYIGRYFFQFGITIVVAVLVSLFVSFTLDPMLSSVWRDPAQQRFRRFPWLGTVMLRVEQGVEALHRAYGRGLAWALRDGRSFLFLGNRGLVLWGAAGVFAGSLLLLPLIGTEFFPRNDEGFISLRLRAPVGSSLDYTDAKTRQVEEALAAFPEIETLEAQVGTYEGKNYARLNLRLTDVEKTGRRPQHEVERAIRARLASIAGIEPTIGFEDGVRVSILGQDQARLKQIADDLMARMAAIPGIADLESSETGENPTVAVRIKRELAADLGITTERIGQALRPLVAGEQISQWLGPDGQDYDVVVQLPQSEREVSADLAELYLTSTRLDADGLPLLVPLRQVADIVPTAGPLQIKRLNLQRRVTLTARAQGRAAGDVGSDIEHLVRQTELPPGYRVDIGGQQEMMKDTFSATLAAMGLAVVFIYFILASQFASFVQPVAIMASLPLSFVGAFLALLLTGTTLNMFSMVGMILLLGLVTKNAILLVDFTNQRMREGAPLRQALLDAGQVRLRPILMTTLAMIFGMLPMAMGTGSGGGMNAPMARAVIGGVITSTLLTLVVVPVIYTYLHAFALRAKRWFAAPDETAPATVVQLGADACPPASSSGTPN